MLFSSRVRFNVWLVSGYAHVSIRFIVTVAVAHPRSTMSKLPTYFASDDTKYCTDFFRHRKLIHKYHVLERFKKWRAVSPQKVLQLKAIWPCDSETTWCQFTN